MSKLLEKKYKTLTLFGIRGYIFVAIFFMGDFNFFSAFFSIPNISGIASAANNPK